MLRWLTSGESHGPALAGILEGLPAGVEVTTADIQAALARRRLGYGRGARMTFETDEVRILAGVRHGLTQGGPIAIEIGNSEWPKWVDVMSADPVRCFHAETSAEMVAEIDICQKAGDTLGGVVEVLAYGVPTGLGSYVHADRRLDARLAGALVGVQAIKGAEIGDGFRTAARRGSQAHDEIERDPATGLIRRRTNRAGGIEGGVSNGEVVRVRAAMKPISTVPRALATVDVASGEPTQAIHQRS